MIVRARVRGRDCWVAVTEKGSERDGRDGRRGGGE